MIVVRATGGLGNQLFQYALGRRLSLDRAVPLRIDTRALGRDNGREYVLDRFKIKAQLATMDEVYSSKGGRGLFGKVRRRFENFRPYHMRSWIKENGFHFDESILRVPRKAYLEGYWQSPKYFECIREIILDDLQPAESVSTRSRAIMKNIFEVESVSVHVRRGDFLATGNSHPILPVEYYQAAKRLVEKYVNKPTYFVFSDDIEWCVEKRIFGDSAVYVGKDAPGSAHEDLWLMTLCSCHIIANSSFSWWGAWLSKCKQKTVVAPRIWSIHENKDRLPAEWYVL